MGDTLAIKETLNAFARNLRLTDQECQNMTHVARRYLALHTHGTQSQEIAYRMIGDDFDLVKLRTHSPSLAIYASSSVPIHVPTFVHLVREGFHDDAPEPYALKKFRYAIFPRPVGEETWATLARPNQWKEKACFLATHSFRNNPVFYKVIEAVMGGDKDSVADLHSQLLAYVSPCGETLAKDIGTLIGQLSISNELLLDADRVEVEIQQPSPTDDGVPKLDAAITMRNEPTGSPDLSALDMEDFRRRAGLAPTFDSVKLAKQMILARSPWPKKSAPHMSSIMGRNQMNIPPLENDQERATALQALHILAAASPTVFDPNESPTCRTLAGLTHRLDWSKEELLAHAIGAEKLLDERMFERFTKHVPLNDPVLVAAIVRL